VRGFGYSFNETGGATIVGGNTESVAQPA
jgi:hypothetical protein